MAIRNTEDFAVTNIYKLAFQFEGGQTDIINCVGTLNGSTEMRTITKTCNGIDEEISKPQKLTVALTAFLSPDTVRDVFGLTNDQLKTGVYSYGAKSTGKKLALVARFKDDFTDQEKIIAIPVMRTTSGLNFDADGDGTEAVKTTMDLTAGLDDLQNLYYEAMIGTDGVSDLEAQKWETEFTTTLVKEA